MPDFLKELQLPVAVLVGLAIAIWVSREATRLLMASRTKLRDEALSREIAYLDDQLASFYLPLRERLVLSRTLSHTTQQWMTAPDGGYDNENPVLPVRGGQATALRKIAVRRVFLPLNRQMEQLILDNGRFRDGEDATDYAAILQHLVLWRALEEAVVDHEIESYDGAKVLPFPSQAADAFGESCSRLLERRERLRRDLFEYGDPSRHIASRSAHDV